MAKIWLETNKKVITMQPSTKQEETEKATTESIAEDPVCGMTVNPDTAAGSFEYQGQTYYFCSTHCLNKFREDPERYLNKATDPMASQPVGIRHESKPAATPVTQTYTCPMHPEVRQNKPGSCPKCGMALERVAPQTPAEKIEYTCPMHPQIVRDARQLSHLRHGVGAAHCFTRRRERILSWSI